MPKTKATTLEVTLRIENLHDGSVGEDLLLGRLELFGGTHHVQFLKVQEVSAEEAGGKTEQMPTLDPHGHYEDLQSLHPACRYSTVKLPGFEGEYVMLVHPYED